MGSGVGGVVVNKQPAETSEDNEEEIRVCKS